MARSPDPCANHLLLAVQRAPLALDPQNPLPHVKREVVVSVLGHRRQNGDTGVKCFSDDLCFGYGTLAVRAMHERMFVHSVLRDKTSLSEMCDFA
jgi:hypothetical protein